MSRYRNDQYNRYINRKLLQSGLVGGGTGGGGGDATEATLQLILAQLTASNLEVNVQTVTSMVTTAGTIPAGTIYWSVTNLGENGQTTTFSDMSVNGLVHPANDGNTTFIAVEGDVLPKGEVYEAIAYNPNPSGAATPNTLYIQYKIPI